MIVTDQDILRKLSLRVDSVFEAEELIKELTRELTHYKSGVGLSAVQIGILKRVSIVKDKDGIIIPLINPIVVQLEDSIIFKNEGCLSVPGKWGNTKRFQTIMIDNNIIEENKFVIQRQLYYYELGAIDITSIVVQHEIDHMNGILFEDHKIIKAGRNDPCPCGSGLKYKKCCGAQ